MFVTFTGGIFITFTIFTHSSGILNKGFGSPAFLQDYKIHLSFLLRECGMVFRHGNQHTFFENYKQLKDALYVNKRCLWCYFAFSWGTRNVTLLLLRTFSGVFTEWQYSCSQRWKHKTGPGSGLHGHRHWYLSFRRGKDDNISTNTAITPADLPRVAL